MQRAGLGLVFLAAASRHAPPSTPEMTRVEPDILHADGGGDLDVFGAHFAPDVRLNFNHPSSSVVDDHFLLTLTAANGDATPLGAVQRLGADHLRGLVPSGIAAGSYALHLSDPAGQQAQLDGALEILPGECDQDSQCPRDDPCMAPRCVDSACTAEPLANPPPEADATACHNGIDDDCDGDADGLDADCATPIEVSPGCVSVDGDVSAWALVPWPEPAARHAYVGATPALTYMAGATIEVCDVQIVNWIF